MSIQNYFELDFSPKWLRAILSHSPQEFHKLKIQNNLLHCHMTTQTFYRLNCIESLLVISHVLSEEMSALELGTNDVSGTAIVSYHIAHSAYLGNMLFDSKNNCVKCTDK